MNYTEETFGSARVAVSRWRPESRPSATVVAVHGFGVDGYRTYRYVADLLSSAGIDVVAPDLPGFGKSGKLDRYSLSLYADIIAELAQEFETPVIGMGHSMGAKVVLAAMIDHPDIFERYVLINPGGFSVIGPWIVRQADKKAIVKLISSSLVQNVLGRTPLRFFT